MDPHTRAGPKARGKGLATRDEGASEPVREAPPEHIPWSYGSDRITAMAVDPDTMYAYWEVTDPSIEAARERLGPAGKTAWLNLRISDTTGRLFDGTNANNYFDHRLERGDRQWFFHVGKPTSTAVVEVGLMSSEGYFAAVARSGRVEFPRKQPLPHSATEWMTVRVETGDVLGSTTAPHVGSGGSGPAQSTSNGHSHEHLSRHRWIPIQEFREGHNWWKTDDFSWEEFFSMAFRVSHRTLEWAGTVTGESWEAGPFSYPVEVLPPVAEHFEGPTVVYQTSEGETRVVFGPWRVVVRGLGAYRRREILSQWTVHRYWNVEELSPEFVYRMVRSVGGSEQWLGASGRMFRGGSEVRLGGASEVYYLGASELAFLGASETGFLAASEWRMRGASERRFAGASEWQLRGASERLYGGASELFGASERWQLGASELRLGGSEERLGGSETRLDVDEGDPLASPPGAWPPPADSKS